jgi:protein-tyrosine phosphatase
MPRPNPPDLSYAIQVDFLPASALPLPGRLGLTRAPGRWAPGRSRDPDFWLREDLEALAGSHDVQVLVTLLEQHELAELGDLEGAARGAGLAWLPFPIPDMWIPSDLTVTRHLVAEILRALEGGDGVVIHCWGGLGRAGTIAACCLVARGTPPERALALVRAARDGAVQSDVQEQFVLSFAQGLDAGQRGADYP